MNGPSPRPGLLQRESTAFVVILATTAVACWPWCVPGRVVFGQRDTAFTVLASHHLQQALMGLRAWQRGPLGWPTPLSVTQADFTAGQAVLAMPLDWMGIESFAAMAVVSFLGVFLTAWCCHRLVRALLGPGPHCWVAAIAAGCHPLHLLHAQHANLLHHEWMVLGALLLGAGLAMRRAGLAFGGGVVLLLAPWFGLYMGLHAALVALTVLGGAAIARLGDRRCWLAALAGLSLGTLAFLPVLSVYARAGFLFEVWTDPSELAAWSWDPAATLAPVARSSLHAALFSLEGATTGWTVNNPANPGYTAFGLALVGLSSLRSLPGRRWAWGVGLAVVVAAALLALGPVLVWKGQATALPGPCRLVDWIPGFYGLRDPVRWLGVSFTALGLFAGAGAWVLARFARRWGRLPPVLLCGGLLVLLLAERASPKTGADGQLRLHPVYGELGLLEGEGPLWDSVLASWPGPRSCRCTATQAYRAALEHDRPLVGGITARKTGALDLLERQLRDFPSDDSVELLRILGTRAVLDHGGRAGGASEHLSCRPVRGHDLCVLEPRAPLPAPSAVGTVGEGPVVGLRWPERRVTTLEVRCGDRVTRSSAMTWRVATALRIGTAGNTVDFFFERPCDDALEATPTGWVPLYAADDASPWPDSWEHVSQ